MRTISIPELVFSDWYAWQNRGSFPLKEFPGVYLISITPKPGLQDNPPRWEDVVYIGITNSKGGLRSRWRQFDSAIHGKRGHSGGNTAFAQLGQYESWTDQLLVSAMGVKCDVLRPSSDDYIRMGWVAFFEYEAFSLYSRTVGGHPRYNTK